MKNQDILKLLKDIFSKEKIKDYTLVLDKKLHIGNSYLKNYYDTNREMHIGVKELKDVFNRDVSDKLLVKAVISIYHEITNKPLLESAKIMISRELLCQYVLKEKRAEPPGLALSCPLHSKK